MKKPFKHKENVHKITFTGFDYGVVLVLTNCVQTSVNARVTGYDSSTTRAAHLYNDNDEPISVIVLGANENAGTVVHESWHAVRRMMKLRRAKLDNETVAYHLEYLVTEILDFKSKVKKENK